MLTDARLNSLLAAFPRCRIAVLGDFCLDVYWELEMAASEISMETGVPTRPVRRSRQALGAAGTVVNNLAALGVGRIAVFGAVGPDAFGAAMLAQMDTLGLDRDGMIRLGDPDWQTPAYVKPYDGPQELERLDLGLYNQADDALAARLLAGLEQALPELDLVILHLQYSHGLHNLALRQGLGALMGRRPDLPFLYEGRAAPTSYPDAVLKLNDREACHAVGLELPADLAPDAALAPDLAARAARALAARQRRPLMVTCGPRGCLVATADGEMRSVPGIPVEGPVDIVGAGDAFMAGAAAALAAGASYAEAAQIGNLSGRATVVQLRQTGVATPAMLRDLAPLARAQG